MINSTPENRLNSDFSAGFWRLTDPKISLASMASTFLGACLAAAHREIHVGWLSFTIFGFFSAPAHDAMTEGRSPPSGLQPGALHYFSRGRAHSTGAIANGL